MSTLYRKYRPQNFKDVIGQNHIKITLQHELERGEIGHAYLFCGPRGLGKTTTARLFAKSLNCQNLQAGQSEPCNECDSCKEIMGHHSIDVIEIDAASNTGVDNVRENIIENARFLPVHSKYKVFIIDEVHMLSASAFNALLKTLEEPPAHAVFILCTTETHKLPATIISRCQRFDLKKVSSKELFNRLSYIVQAEGKKVEDEVLKNIILHSDGCVRDAESLLGKILTLGDDIKSDQAEIILPRSDFKSIINFLFFLSEKNATGGIELINKLMDEGVDLINFADDLLEFLRKILLIKINGNLGDFGIELEESAEESAQKLAAKFNQQELIGLIKLFLEKQKEIKFATLPQFSLELAVAEFCQQAFQSNVQFMAKKPEPVKAEKPIEKISQKEVEPSAEVIEEAKNEAAEPVQEVEVAAENFTDESGEVDVAAIAASWQALIEKVGEKNFSLSELLKSSKPLRANGKTIDIGVMSKFYKERLEHHQAKSLVEEILSGLIGVKVMVRGVIMEELRPKDLPSNVGSFKATAPVQTPPAPDLPPLKVEKPQDVLGEVASLF